MSDEVLKPVAWVGSSKKDFRTFPDDVQDAMGFALYQAQVGDWHAMMKPMKGFGGTGVVELVENDKGDTYRAVYTVRFAEAVYVLHAFQKKTQKTAKQDIEIGQQRYQQMIEYRESQLSTENSDD